RRTAAAATSGQISTSTSSRLVATGGVAPARPRAYPASVHLAALCAAAFSSISRTTSAIFSLCWPGGAPSRAAARGSPSRESRSGLVRTPHPASRAVLLSAVEPETLQRLSVEKTLRNDCCLGGTGSRHDGNPSSRGGLI